METKTLLNFLYLKLHLIIRSKISFFEHLATNLKNIHNEAYFVFSHTDCVTLPVFTVGHER